MLSQSMRQLSNYNYITFQQKLGSDHWVYRTDLNAVITLSNDLDSLISSCFYSFLTNYPITHFYSFDDFYSIDAMDTREQIGIDIGLNNGKCIDNHVQRLFMKSNINPQSVNYNSQYIISRENYINKFAMSTLIIMYSLFKDKIPLPQSDTGKMLVLLIDSGYKGFYNRKYHHAFVKNLIALGLEDLLEVLERHTWSDFHNMSQKLKAMFGTTIVLNDEGKLHFKSETKTLEELERILSIISNALGFPISLPKQTFVHVQKFKTHELDPNYVLNDLHSNMKIFSFAITDRGTIKASYIA